ncbi:recombinase RAD52 KNAG_0B03410 [Huiozyma naganishii CBS 8797]|uniref:DNA repair and recombination protein RAD52 n=1 Tax=Huiozyma naganishii (strain ATCC MYA-139 / BCRC 22969 / CBS 8797 / KCTC 17520 / NBRC 10181 / NCYC 3082 / Yp74L-3) TaxID=1071383 RepID=J7RGX0_HUIN7|nr:hypothetical protein KNAG_0B03410 [Kazachstania naganishii CBS 8797]CCK68783.1 hypothetical protein KNAG_0B03410 [Kazachstania naganishii CBS 8797]
MEDKKCFQHSSDDIQAKLDKKLGPEYISKRVGFGTSRVAYIEGWRAINLANQIFGYNGWSTEVKNVIIDFLDERQGKFCVGCTAIVRVTLANGTYREDIGYGTVENERRKAAAFERAKKSAVTDALKRSLRGFGNALGNCLYDKDFLAKIDKVKFDPPDFDEGNLFRPSDEISEVSRSNTIDNNGNRNGDFPNKKRQLIQIAVSNVKPEPSEKEKSASLRPENIRQNTVADNDMTKKVNRYVGELVNGKPPQAKGMTVEEQEDLLDDSMMFSDDFPDDDLSQGSRHKGSDKAIEPSNDPVTFVTAKAASSLQKKNSEIPQENYFDPNYQAQSIKHTIDQTSSKPVPANVTKNENSNFNRDKAYEKFAAKGKAVPAFENMTTTEGGATAKTNYVPHKPATPLPQTGPPPNNNRFAPPSTVVHSNAHMAIPITTQPRTVRREVGRPKINPMALPKRNP